MKRLKQNLPTSTTENNCKKLQLMLVKAFTFSKQTHKCSCLKKMQQRVGNLVWTCIWHINWTTKRSQDSNSHELTTRKKVINDNQLLSQKSKSRHWWQLLTTFKSPQSRQWMPVGKDVQWQLYMSSVNNIL